MNKLLAAMILTATLSVSALADSDLSRDEQIDIIERYMVATGQMERHGLSSATAAEYERPVKCGTPDILRFAEEQSRLDPDLLASMGVTAASRPALAFSFDTPGGRIRIHYATAGDNACYQANLDSDHDGVPNFVEDAGRIADSVYDFTVNRLGYPVPVSDAGCVGGEDDRVDIYLLNLGGTYYGLTYADTACSTDPNLQLVPSWMELDNDYQENGFGVYNKRPLDAVRVTMAHEFFHVIHFSIDARESRAWFEMSAVWMEEEQYDNINDYYSLLPYFYNYPLVSLQSENAPIPLHNYASVVFPIYLTKTYGPDLIKSIWIKSGEMGNAQNWLQAIDFAVDSASGSTANFATSVQEFAVWNYFTGPYSDWAPDNIGFEEKKNYPYIPIERIGQIKEYPDQRSAQNNEFNSQINAASYIQFQNLQDILTDYWECDSTCFDTLSLAPLVIDTFCCDSTHVIDTNFSAFLGFSDRIGMTWGLSFILQLEQYPDSHEVISLPPRTADASIEIEGLKRFKTITMVVTPTSTNPSYFTPLGAEGFGFYLFDTTGFIPIDSSRFYVKNAVLTPYPNPAVVQTMGLGAAAEKGKNIWFRFDVATDSAGTVQYPTSYMTIDLFTLAGERVRTLEQVTQAQDDRNTAPRSYRVEAPWDMKNQSGKDVASGVYVAYVRLYDSALKKDLLAEDHVKVAVIR